MRAVIAGTGHTAYSRGSGRTEWDLAIEAVERAAEDAGIAPSDVDGLVRFTYDAVDEAMLTRSFGMRLTWQSQTPYGGLGSPAVIAHAAAAVESGQARIVVAYRALNGYSGTRYGRAERSLGRSGGPVVAVGDRAPSGAFAAPYGLLAPGQVMAMWVRRYEYVHDVPKGALKRALGRIAIDQRAYAVGNPGAVMRDPLTVEQYEAARPIAEPLGLYDFALETDGAAAVVVTSPEVAGSGRSTARVLGAVQGLLPFGESISIYRELRNTAAYRNVARELYRRAGVEPGDISAAMLYDATTVTVLLGYEAYGFAGEGEAWRVIAEHGLGPSSPLPVNTNGGHLSEAYVHGFNSLLEAVAQCRGRSCNQLDDVRAVLWSSGSSGVVLAP